MMLPGVAFAAVLAVACGSEEASPTKASDGTSPPPTAPTFDNTDAGTTPDDANCAATSAETAKAKVDVIFVIDDSGSMSSEMAQVRQNVNKFASTIGNVGLDLHVVFIVKRGMPTNNPFTNDICVPEPLAGPSCTDKLPGFFHVPQDVQSTNSFKLILSTYDSTDTKLRWSDKLRLEATKIFIEVTDDGSDMKYTAFDSALLAKAPAGMFGTAQSRKYIFHSIVSKPAAAAIPSTAVCKGAAGSSVDYQQLSQLTGGIVDEVCKTDYSSVLDNIAKNVVDKLGCELGYPAAQAADPTKVVVQFTPAGSAGKTLTQVTDESKCSQVQDGWHYDNDANPTKIILCPSMCTTANATPGSKLEALVGCKAPAPR